MKQSIIVLLFLLSFISIVHGASSYSCEQYEHRVYQLTVTFPNLQPFYAVLRLLENGEFDELFSVANGNCSDEVGATFALSNRVGYYSCSSPTTMYLTGLGFLYKSDTPDFLKVNGAIVIHDYSFRFYNQGRNCDGKIKYAVFPSGTNPFKRDNDPVHEGPLGTVKCEQLKFRRYYKLTDV